MLDHGSRAAAVNYYRCDCGHVWTASKETDKVVTHITPLPNDQRPDDQ